MPHAYTKDQLVEQPAIRLFAELCWTAATIMQRLRQTCVLLRSRLLSGLVLTEFGWSMMSALQNFCRTCDLLLRRLLSERSGDDKHGGFDVEISEPALIEPGRFVTEDPKRSPHRNGPLPVICNPFDSNVCYGKSGLQSALNQPSKTI